MNQAVTFNFAIQKNERVYQLIVLPGSPWEEIDEVLLEFQKEILDLKAAALEAEAKKNLVESEVAKASDEVVVEPELVQGE